MKKTLTIALVMVLALSLLSACSVSTSSDKDGGGSTPASGGSNNSGGKSGELTLAALKQAAKDAGFTTNEGCTYTQLPEPKDGFTIRDKDKYDAIYINEFASEQDARSYADNFLAEYPVEDGFHIAILDKFIVELGFFSGDEIFKLESDLLAAYKAAGWIFVNHADSGGSTPAPGGNENPSGTPSGGENNSPAPGGNENGDGSISLDKTDYKGGEEITVTVSGVTAQMVSARGFIGLYKQGDTDNVWQTYIYLIISNTEYSFTAPSNAGNYEMRLFSKNVYGHESTGTADRLIMSVPFTVGGGSGTANTGTSNNSGGEAVAPVTLRTEAEVLAILTNFSMSFKFEAQGEKPITLHQAFCEDGMFFKKTGDNPSFYLYDFAKKLGYMLDEASKKGMYKPIPPDVIGNLKAFDWNISSPLFYSDSNMNSLIPVGSDTLLGRAVTLYSYPDDVAWDNMKQTYWVDNEYGFPLKYTQIGANELIIEATEFKVGGITVAGMINLNDYTLTEATD
jgi:hypothetical protein